MRRGIMFSHRDFDYLLNDLESGRKFYLYTGRGPSSPSFHLGHLLPFMFTQYLQQAFDVPVVIQMTDDEKYLYRDISPAEIEYNLIENCKDIIACGFNPQKTFIFSNLEYMGSLYKNVVKIQRHVTNSQIAAIYGVKPSDNIGQTAFPAVQAAPSFVSSFPVVLQNMQNLTYQPRCLIPCGIDQDPYFRMTRDVAPRLGYPKPALLHSKFLPSLQGMTGKMSSSLPNSSIFLTDTPKQISEKISSHALSGGRKSLAEHRALGADLDVDVCFNYLCFFLENDEELESIAQRYKAGEMLTREVKARTTEVLCEVVRRHQQARAQVTDDVVRQFMSVRPLDC